MKTKKSILCLLCLLLVVPFYLTYLFFSGSKTKDGKLLADEVQSFVVSVEDGAVTPSSHAVAVQFANAGSHNVYVTIDVTDPSFAIGYVVKAPSGKILTALTSYGLENLSCPINAEAGKQTFELYFLGTRDAMADFAKTCYGYSDGKQLEDYLAQYDFSAPLENGDRTVNFSLKIHEYEVTSYPLIYQLLPVILGALLLLFLFLALSRESAEGASIRERISGVGNCYSILATAVVFTQVTVVFVLHNFAAEFTSAHVVTLSLLLTILSVDVIGFSLTWISTRNIPKTVIPQQKMGVGKFLLFVLMGAGIVGAGGLLGYYVHNAIVSPVGSPDSDLSFLMMNSGFFLRVLTVGICAPIFEELLFRKLLIDRLIKHGEFIAIFTSGLFFGLFHGNFQQFFFAFGLGCLWAFVYARTGRIRYSICMHMIINLSTSIVSVYLLNKSAEGVALLENTDTEAIMALSAENPSAFLSLMLFGLWIIFIAVAAIVGLIVLITFLAKKKFRLKKLDGEVSKGAALGALFTSGFAWVFLLSVICMFLESYLPYFLS